MPRMARNVMTEIRVASHESFRVHWYSVNVTRGKKQMSA
jgi:hypothetical protein